MPEARDFIDHILRVGDLELRSRSTPSTSPGTSVTVHVDPTKVTAIPLG